MNNQIDLYLNHPSKIYYSGQTVSGKLFYNNLNDIKVQCIWFSLIGYGEFSSNNIQEHEHQTQNSSQYMKYYIFGSKHGKCLKLFKGCTMFQFSFKLKYNIPTSLHSSDISYQLKFVVEKPWKLNEVYKTPIHVLNYFDINEFNANIFQCKKTKTYGFLKEFSVALKCFIPNIDYIENKNISICMEFLNESVNILNVKVELFKTICYYPISKNHNLKCVKQRVDKMVFNIDKTQITHFLQCTIVSQEEEAKVSNLFNIKYDACISFKFSKFHKKTCISVPIMTKDVPLFKFEPKLTKKLPEIVFNEIELNREPYNLNLLPRNMSTSENHVNRNFYNQNIVKNWNSMYLPPSYDEISF